MTKSDFTSDSAAYGLKDQQFAHLSDSDQKKLLRLMARISEKSFRRGFQHGAYASDMGADTYSALVYGLCLKQ